MIETVIYGITGLFFIGFGIYLYFMFNAKDDDGDYY